MEEFIWSGTDFPYACLIDKERTLTFKRAIDQSVKPGDIVIDVGSGTGIMSLFAAKAGAKKVYSVEVDHLLATSLRQTVKMNGMDDVIEVVESNALTANLPKNADVIVAELIETGLLDEMQVEVMNHLHKIGVIGADTKLIPTAYETFIKPVNVNNEFYGFKIAAPLHDWPYYSHEAAGWHPLELRYLSDAESLGYFDFKAGHVDPVINKTISFKIDGNQEVNAIEISGIAHLTPDIMVNDVNTFNGNKIMSLENPVSGVDELKLKFQYEMARGLGNFNFSVL